MLRSRSARAWRGVAAAAVATFAAAVSHAAADGHPAPWLGVLLAFTFAAPTCVALAGKRLSWGRLSIAVAVSQLGFHALMLIGLGEHLGATSFSSPMTGMAGHGMLIATVTASGVMPAGTHAGVWMGVAHAAAAAVTILAIGHGERAVRSLLGLAGWDLLVRLLVWRPAPVRVRRPAVSVRLDAHAAAVVGSVVRRRGPPVTA